MEGEAQEQERILLVVEAALQDELRRFLTQEGFVVEVADSAATMIGMLGERRFHLALVDVSLSGMDAAAAVPRSLEADPDLAIIVLARMEDATTAAICLQQGAFEFVSHPAEHRQLRLAVDRALRRRGTELQTQQISAWLKQELVARTRELERERQKLQQINVTTLTALINALEAKDPDFVGHSVRVAELAASVAAEMGLSDDEIEAVRAAGRLHDLGKIGVRDEVLRKRGPLTPEEQQHIRDQVLVGFRILAPLSHLGAVRQYVRSHHEQWDGQGYPDGLKGLEIPIGARIVFAAEIYDAITSPRPYQERLPHQAALAQLQKLSGTKLDPSVVEALASVVSRRKSLVFVRDDDHGRS